MDSPGKYFKAERESRKLSLSEVSESTKIREPLLKAIEEDRYDSLPAGYLKGFLDTYARYLGLDTEEVILWYRKYAETLPPPRATEWNPVSGRVVSPRKQLKSWVFILLIVWGLLIGVFVYYAFDPFQQVENLLLP